MRKKPVKNSVLLSVKKNRNLIYLALILLLAVFFRFNYLNWDNGYNFHPDERAIVMFTIPLEMPKNIAQFLSPDSPLNPSFFAYGNMPIYLLKISSEIASIANPLLNEYGYIHLVGRFLSALSDVGTTILVFLIGKLLFNRRVGVLASLIYASSVFPIQLSHFYAVDTMLNFFMLGFLYFLILLIKKGSIKLSLLVGIFLGLSLATKISSLILIPTLVIGLISYLLSKKKYFNKVKTYIPFFIIPLSSIFIFIITQPYVLIDFQEFVKQTTLQSQMSKDPFVFPYTLQYVGKISYFHELKNIFLYGLGPYHGIICLLGFAYLIFNLAKHRLTLTSPFLLFIFYGIFYFAIFGSFAVGWMRYMLPVYPFLAVLGGYFISEFAMPRLPKKVMSRYAFRKTLLFIFVLLTITYPLSFISIYSKPNTRIQASEWINNNIPAGTTIAVEHWDDSLPVHGGHKYIQLSLPLYEPDTEKKWKDINETLSKTDYIIIASNRLYVPLQKLTNCKSLPPGRCYKTTSAYYKRLFSEQMGFEKVVQFSEYPTIPFTNFSLNDDKADESFTVLDHPKIIIFKKIY